MLAVAGATLQAMARDPSECGDGRRAVRQLYGADRYDRLARIKRRYDPANMFRVNHNIEPTAENGQ